MIISVSLTIFDTASPNPGIILYLVGSSPPSSSSGWFLFLFLRCALRSILILLLLSVSDDLDDSDTVEVTDSIRGSSVTTEP